MILPGASGQATRHYGFRADGTITTGGTAQLLLPESETRSFLLVHNISTGPLYIDFGAARAHCTLTSGVVSSIVVDNGGFGYTLPPVVQFLGGLSGVSSTALNAAKDTSQPVPTAAYGGSQASAIAVLSGGAVTSITIQSGGSGYQCPPYVFLRNQPQDPFGVASASATSGILLPANGGSYYVNGTACPTDAISIYGATTGQAFTCMWMR